MLWSSTNYQVTKIWVVRTHNWESRQMQMDPTDLDGVPIYVVYIVQFTLALLALCVKAIRC